MNTRTPSNTVPTALRHLLAQILLALRNSVPQLRVPFACFVLAGAWAAVLFLTGSTDALGRMVPWPVSLVLFTTLLIITVVGGSVRRPDTFSHENAWNRAKAIFLAVATVALATCYMALLFAEPTPLTPSPAT